MLGTYLYAANVVRWESEADAELKTILQVHQKMEAHK